MKIGGDGCDARFQSMRCLVAGGGAEIEKSLAGREVEEWDNRLRTDVLNAQVLDFAG